MVFGDTFIYILTAEILNKIIISQTTNRI